MDKNYDEIMFHETDNNGCNIYEEAILTNRFERIVKEVASTRQSYFELKDCSLAKKQGVDGFTLAIERVKICECEPWWGTFEYGNKKLKILITL